MQWMHSLSPKILILVEGDMNFNSLSFLATFREAVFRLAAIYESVDSIIPLSAPERKALDAFFAIDLLNSISCEGLSRFARPEREEQWADRMQMMGYEEADFPKEAWEAFMSMSSLDSKLKVKQCGKRAKLQWAGTPNHFASLWVPC